MSQYKLILQGSNDVKETLIYDPMTSEMFWETTGERPTLTHISHGLEYQINAKVWTPAKITNPHNPELLYWALLEYVNGVTKAGGGGAAGLLPPTYTKLALVTSAPRSA